MQILLAGFPPAKNLEGAQKLPRLKLILKLKDPADTCSMQKAGNFLAGCTDLGPP